MLHVAKQEIIITPGIHAFTRAVVIAVTKSGVLTTGGE